jgi:hypothetical protein
MLNGVAEIRRDLAKVVPNLELALRVLAERALTGTAGAGAAIAISNGEEMICRGSAGSSVPAIGARFSLGAGFSGECVRSGAPLCCDDVASDERVDRQACRALGIRSILAVPVRSGAMVVGVVEVFSPAPRAFGEESKIFLQRLADMVLPAMERALHVPALNSRSSMNAYSDAIRMDNEDATNEDAANEHPKKSREGELPEEPQPANRRSYSNWRLVGAFGAASLILIAAAMVVPRMGDRGTSHDGGGRAGLAPRRQSPASDSSRPGESDLDRLRRLAEQGDPTAQFALGAQYSTGEEVPRDYQMAFRWFAKAAEQGHVVAQATLGAYYWSGTGVTLDLDKAYFWSVLAQAGGDEASKYRLEALASHMSRSRIIAAQESANDWLLQHQRAGESLDPQQ